MSAEHIRNFYLYLGNSPLAAALLALSFAEGPSYNGFVLAAVRGKTQSTYAADLGSGWVGKRPFGAELRINGDAEEKSAKRPPIYALSLPYLSNYFGHRFLLFKKQINSYCRHRDSLLLTDMLDKLKSRG